MSVQPFSCNKGGETENNCQRKHSSEGRKLPPYLYLADMNTDAQCLSKRSMQATMKVVPPIVAI